MARADQLVARGAAALVAVAQRQAAEQAAGRRAPARHLGIVLYILEIQID